MTKGVTGCFFEYLATSNLKEAHTMTEAMMALKEQLSKYGVQLDDEDFLREALRCLAQMLMEGEVTQQIGAERYERTNTPSDATT